MNADVVVLGAGMVGICVAVHLQKRGRAVTLLALAVPAAVSIPLTSRGVSESFWVVTGTTMTGALSADVALAAQSTATVVILVVRVLRRRALNRLVEARFKSGLCVLCGADLRFGKEQCPKCGQEALFLERVRGDPRIGKAPRRIQFADGHHRGRPRTAR